GIPISTLPKTVQDAALVCQSLGIRCLWADAMCIIQDDREDWERESAQMCDIYANSHITIAVHHADSCKRGFLGGQRYPLPEYEREFNTTFGAGIPGANAEKMVLVRKGSSHHKLEKSTGTALEARGWTLQERILPRRIIHYTRG
ncbi:heterokaryon incompatibility, partial [Immersiella caudata]